MRVRSETLAQYPTRLVKWFRHCCFLLLLLSCQEEPTFADPLAGILSGPDPALSTVMSDPAAYELQIRYSRILRQGDSVAFRDYDYRVDPSRYFYPASTVKFPIAVLALEKLAASDSLHRSMSYYYEGDSVVQSFERDILEIFAVSDNHASNRLFEFLGQDAINDSLKARGIEKVRIAHRLGFRREETTTVPLIIRLNDSLSTQTLPLENTAPRPLELEGLEKGIGFMRGDSLIEEPFDFSLKNYLPVGSLHGILKRVVFPEAFPESARFRMDPEQREFLLHAMQITPREAGYDPEAYPDGYGKFFIYGDSPDPIPETLQIFNKVGYAYGTVTDCAYVRDRENGIEFLLTATLLVNKNGIFNDNVYEFDTVGIPFLSALGRAVYAYEKAHPTVP